MKMQKPLRLSLYLLALVALFYLAHPLSLHAQQDSSQAQIRDLQGKQKVLETKTKTLLARLVEERENILEKMRLETIKKMEEWEDDPEYLNGQGLAAAIYNAEEVAKGYGMKVEKLRAMYQATKKMILGLEMTGKCGEGSPHLKDMEEAIDSVSETVRGALDFFGLASNEEERLACVQAEKLKLYREVNRAYIYALTAKSAKDSAKGFRQYAQSILNISGSDAKFLAEQAEKMAKTQDTVVMIFEMTPIIGDLLDLYKLGVGTNALGDKASEFDRALTAVFLFTPGIAEQAFKRYPEIFLGMKSFVGELVQPAGGFFDRLIVKTGKNLSDVKKRAGDLWDEMLRVEKELSGKAAGKVSNVYGESMDAIWARMRRMPGFNATSEMAIQASHMVRSHADAMIEVAARRGEVIMFRPFSAQGTQAMEEAIESGNRLVTKWIDVKPKSASNPLLGAAIPINPALSKYEKALREARALKDMEKVAEIQRDIKKMKKEVNSLFAKTDHKGNKLVDKMAATFNDGGVQKKVLWAPDAEGNVVMGVRNADGKLFDPITNKVFDIDADTAKEVLIFTDPKGGKILPDYDMFAVGSKARPNDRVIAPNGAILDEVSVNAGKQGGLSQLNQQTISDINSTVKVKTGVGGEVVHHGPANFWKDKPDYPITVFMPNSTVKSIPQGPPGDPDKYIKDFFHALKQEGYQGFNPHPAWGWPPYNPRYGYRTVEEAQALARSAQ